MRRPGSRTAAPPLRAAWTLLTGTGAAASIGLALLVGVGVFICVAAPRASLQNRTHALQRLLATLPAAENSIYASVGYEDFELPFDSPIQAAGITAARAELGANLARTQLPFTAAHADWSGLTTSFTAVTGAAPSAVAGPLPPRLEILYRDALAGNSRLVAGRLPVAGTRTPGGTVFQAAITAATGQRFSLHVGSRLKLSGGAALAITGLITPVSPEAAFWTIDPTAALPLVISTPQTTPYWTGAAFVGPAELTGLQSAGLSIAQATLGWDFPLQLSGITANQAQNLQNEVTAAVTQAGTLDASTNGTPTDVTIGTGLATDLSNFTAADATTSSLLSLLFVSLTVIGAVVVLLGARLLTEHRDGEFALLRARGAALYQLAWIALRAGAVVVLPAALAAVAIALAVTPGAADPLAWWLAGFTVAVALAGPPVIAVRRHAAAGPRSGRRGPQTAPHRRAAARRLVAEATGVCAAVGGLVELRLQGLPAAGGTDFYLSAAPVLVAIPAAVLVVRCYPAALRWLLRLAGTRRGATAFLGLARSARTSPASVLPAFALVLALAVIAFGSMVRAAVLRGEIAASWQTTGADAVVGAPGSGISLTPPAQQAIAAVPGVERTAAVLETSGSVGPPSLGGTPFNVAVLDPVRYAAVLADTPAPPFPAAALARPRGGGADGLVPVLASPSAAALLRQSGGVVTIGLRAVRIRLAGSIASTPAMPEAGSFIVFPQWAAGPDPLPPDLLFLAGPRIDDRVLSATVRRTAPAEVVTLRSGVLAGLRAAPLPQAGYLAFAQGTAAAAAFSVLILLLTLLLGARSRELTLARLSTMGLSPGQGGRVAIVETLPSVLAATVGGLACASALAPLVGPELDLSVFTGYGFSVPVRADAGSLALAGGGLILLTLATLAAAALVASRRGVSRALRAGE